MFFRSIPCLRVLPSATGKTIRTKWICCASAAWLLALPAAFAATYYVDAVAGSDSNAGTSTSAPWKTIAKVNQAKLGGGDQIRFQGGQTHAGNLVIAKPSNGASGNPITISSYGTGRATIFAATGDGIKLSNVAYVTVTNLNVAGPGWNAVNDGSRGVVLAGNASYCVVNQVIVTGFHKAGIRSENNSHHNTITFARAEQNGYIGIHISGNNHLVSDCQAISNNGDVTVTNNWSGSGILANAASFVTIEYCEAALNGSGQPWTGNGPVGIWCWDADSVVIRHCISRDNKRGRGSADGGGFDLDGGATNCRIEYCYSYNNAGAGYLAYNFDWQGILHQDNTIRYCISENDRQAGIGIGTSGLPIENLAVHNVVSFNTNGSIALRNHGGTVSNTSVRNSVLATSGTLGIGSNSFILQGNCYYSTAAAYNFGSYGSNFAAWIVGTGKEQVNGQPVGYNGDPGLMDLGSGTKLTDPRQLAALRSYSPATGYAAVVDSGLDLQAAFGINPGSEDLIGAVIPVRTFDRGAYEYQGGTGSDTVPPTVELTAPAEGATLSGSSVTVSADASDDIGGSGIAGVRFKLDGMDLGVEDTVAPYSVTWNTLTAANGAHTLAAVARDAAGNTTASTSVDVTVFNDPVAEPWTSQGIGSTALAGTFQNDSGTFTVSASGADIWGSADAFYFVRCVARLSGDGTIVARVQSLTNTNSAAKAGVMIRETTAANSKCAFVKVSPVNALAFQARTTTGGATEAVGSVAGITAPQWLKLTRAGSLFSAYYSTDGVTWTQVGASRSITMAAEVEIGLAVTSHNNAALCTAVFTDVSVAP